MVELEGVDHVIPLTPIGADWNPHTTAYEQNESNMLDWQGGIVPQQLCMCGH